MQAVTKNGAVSLSHSSASGVARLKACIYFISASFIVVQVWGILTELQMLSETQ